MKLFAWCLSVILLLALQTTLAPAISFNDIQPDFVVCFVLAAAFLGGRTPGTICGFFDGLLQDLATGGILGLHLIPLTIMGYLAGMAERKVFKDHSLLPLLAAGGATLSEGIFAVFFLKLLGLSLGWGESLYEIVLPQAIYNMAVAVPVYGLVRLLYRIP